MPFGDAALVHQPLTADSHISPGNALSRGFLLSSYLRNRAALWPGHSSVEVGAVPGCPRTVGRCGIAPGPGGACSCCRARWAPWVVGAPCPSTLGSGCGWHQAGCPSSARPAGHTGSADSPVQNLHLIVCQLLESRSGGDNPGAIVGAHQVFNNLALSL